MALLDIQGKALGQPLYNLLGGLMRDRVELSMSIHMGPIDEALETARSCASEGFTTVKVKVGRDTARDIEVVHRKPGEFLDRNVFLESPKAAGPKDSSAFSVRMRAGVEIVYTVSR